MFYSIKKSNTWEDVELGTQINSRIQKKTKKTRVGPHPGFAVYSFFSLQWTCPSCQNKEKKKKGKKAKKRTSDLFLIGQNSNWVLTDFITSGVRCKKQHFCQ
jgi:putative sterol carrier protein